MIRLGLLCAAVPSAGLEHGDAAETVGAQAGAAALPEGLGLVGCVDLGQSDLYLAEGVPGSPQRAVRVSRSLTPTTRQTSAALAAALARRRATDSRTCGKTIFRIGFLLTAIPFPSENEE